MTIITVKGYMELTDYLDMVSYHAVLESEAGGGDFDQWFIELALDRYKEVIRNE